MQRLFRRALKNKFGVKFGLEIRLKIICPERFFLLWTLSGKIGTISGLNFSLKFKNLAAEKI
jgi:hypothetical protein